MVRGIRREVISRGYNLLLRGTLATRFSDAQCGFKAIRKDVADRLLPHVQDTGWFFDTELLVLAERTGLRIHEVPVDWIDDPTAESTSSPPRWPTSRHRGRPGRALYLLVRWPLPAPLLVYVAGTAGIALLSSNTTSLPRYLLAAFPLLIPVARQLSDDVYPMVVAASATLMATLFWTTSLVTWLAP